MRKKLAALLALLITGSHLLLAQSHAADSLRQLLTAHPQDDTDKVKLMNQLAVQLRRPRPATTDSLIKAAISISDRLGFKKGKGNALAVKAVRFYDISDFPSSTSTFEEARALLESANDIKGLTYMLRMRANLLMDEGKHAQSLDDFLHGLKLAQQAGDIRQAIDINRTIGYLYNVVGDYEKAIPYQTEALRLADSTGYKIGISGAYNAIGKTYKTQGNYPASLDAYMKGLAIDRELKDSNNIFVSYSNIGDVYERMGKYREAFDYLRPSWSFNLKLPKNTMVPWDEWAMGKAFTHSGNPDSGLYYGKHAYQLSQEMGWRLYLREITALIAESAAKLGQWDTAYKYQVLSSNLKDTLTGKEIASKVAMLQTQFEVDKKQAQIDLQIAENRREKNLLYALGMGLVMLIALAVLLIRNNRTKQKANLLLQKQKAEIDAKANELAVQKENLERSHRNVELLGEIGRTITSSLSVEKIISTVYDKVNSLMDASIFGIGIYNEALKRIEFPATYEKGEALPFYANAITDQNRFAVICFTQRKEIIMGNLGAEYQQYVQHMPTPHAGGQPVSLIFLPLLVKDRILGVITVQSFKENAYSDYQLFMLRNIKIYTAIALENAEAYDKLNQSIVNLRKTQAQLIQSEKMASLGELTAGIAHEIQNPLNFVNNFSEVSNELIEEMKQELASGHPDQAMAIAGDIRVNLEKIAYHGKRADSIVKGMLQHSRNSSSQKEPVDINTLVDECLRLSFHGMRAKDKSFNSKTDIRLDETIPRIQAVSQDIGRVLLNLFTNAFYSVSQKKKTAGEDYEPTVAVSTARQDGQVVISVTDNGLGVSRKVLDKIFQPFFTTKPAGEGTGLGLSMSYEIITKGHGGELKVDSREGDYAIFTIHLPIKNQVES